MKVTAFNGSPREDGNTSILIEKVFSILEKEGIECEEIQIGGRTVHGCTACMQCFENQDMKCIIDEDIVNDCIQRMDQSDGIIIGSPTYYSDLTPEVKGLIDRAGYVSSANDDFLERKIGTGVVSERRAGAIHVLDSINHFFLINQMMIPGSSYWNLGKGRDKGEVKNDHEAIKTMKDLAKNFSWLLKNLNSD